MQELDRQLLFRVPATVDSGLTDPRPGGNVLESQAGETILDEQLAECIEDRSMRALTARPATRDQRGQLGRFLQAHVIASVRWI
jgi:hypothetical protein